MEIYNDTYCVYMHTNKINYKKYVGQTSYGNDPNIRWRNGQGYRGSKVFWSAIQKYGWDNFEHEIIASNLTKEEADNFEKILINKLNLMDREYGYNLKEGGTGGKFSDTTIQKMRDSHSGEKHHMYGKYLSEETKKKIGASNMKTKNNFDDKYIFDILNEKNNDPNIKLSLTNSKKVYQYDLQGNLLVEWGNMTRIAEFYNIGRTTVMRYCRSENIFLDQFILKLERT